MLPACGLNNGVQIPAIGLGTFQMRSVPEDDVIHRTIDHALQFGYRLIDTASVYGNEADIGRSLKELLPKYGLSRKDIFITSKLSPRDHGFDSAEKACMKSLESLDCEYLDLYLIHWPGVQKLKREDPKNAELRRKSWQALEKLYKGGLLRSIGVSNYTIDHLDELLQFATVVPAVLQVEFHPKLYQKKLYEYCKSKGIWLQAYTSLGQGRLLDEEAVRSIAAQYNKSTAQVLLKWALQHGVGIIPKSVRAQHIQDNISVTEFELSVDDMETLDKMNTDTHFCWDPTGVK
ncbi:glyoxal reductase-like isoform X1 [Montipora capricornis]|uniref:glyoxal reductase-like isoform X1 n=1 Tax=Montipora foliosa TaxID=591990 RepID=UPI0035F1EAF8